MMKKIFVIIFVFFTSVASAQWYVGGKGSVTFSNYKTKTPWKEVANTGFAFGATVYKQMSVNMALHVELQYIQKGYYHKICNSISDQLEANYLEIPVMLDYSFLIPFKNFKGHATLGFYTAYWLNGKYKMQGFDTASENLDFEKSGSNHFDFGPNAGGKIEYVLKNGSILLDVRYELGVLDLQKKVNDNTNNTNRAFIIGISYLKPL